MNLTSVSGRAWGWDVRHRNVIVGVMTAVVLLAGVGAAVAGVSDGNYDPARQGCSGHAADSEHPEYTEDGCQNFTTNVSDGSGHEAARAGLPQLAGDENPDPTTATYSVTPDGFDPTTGVHYYTGADDNLNGGEHDGSEQVGVGPSDGGSVVINVDPNSVQAWAVALASGDTQYLATHPLPLIDLGVGACTDGVCWSTQTQRRTAFDGGNPDVAPRDATNYDGHTWDPEDCSSADPADDPDDPNDCGPDGLQYWHDQNGAVYVEPGVSVYEDPSPNGSPLGPYPIPAFYAGTCGVIAGGGPMAQMPASPVTNGAGQIVIPTAC
jgi:hypothetical protein